MTGPDPACLYEVTADRVPVPFAPLNGGPVSDLYRIELLHTLLVAQNVTADLMNCLRAYPDDKAQADNIAGVLGQTIQHAGVMLQRLQNVRECQGQG